MFFFFFTKLIEARYAMWYAISYETSIGHQNPIFKELNREITHILLIISRNIPTIPTNAKYSHK